MSTIDRNRYLRRRILNAANLSIAFATVAYLSVSLAITGLAAWYQHRYPVRTL